MAGLEQAPFAVRNQKRTIELGNSLCDGSTAKFFYVWSILVPTAHSPALFCTCQAQKSLRRARLLRRKVLAPTWLGLVVGPKGDRGSKAFSTTPFGNLYRYLPGAINADLSNHNNSLDGGLELYLQCGE